MILKACLGTLEAFEIRQRRQSSHLCKNLSKAANLTLSRRNSALFERSHQFTLANDTLVDITAPGIISFSVQPTSKPNKRIVLSCGVHGNETAPIEICDDLVKGILTGNITLAHDVLFLFGNLPAMDIAERFVEENMNRLFSGAHSKGEGLVNAERVRAKQLEDAVASFFKAGEGTRYHYDLHTAIRASKMKSLRYILIFMTEYTAKGSWHFSQRVV